MYTAAIEFLENRLEYYKSPEGNKSEKQILSVEHQINEYKRLEEESHKIEVTLRLASNITDRQSQIESLNRCKKGYLTLG